MINNHDFTILIDLRASDSYIDLKFVEMLKFPRRKYEKSWLVKLATRAKRKVVDLVKSCPMDMNGISTKAYVNILPLGSYYYLICMDCL
jgi:hypothetical protein